MLALARMTLATHHRVPLVTDVVLRDIVVLLEVLHCRNNTLLHQLEVAVVHLVAIVVDLLIDRVREMLHAIYDLAGVHAL